jgi:hypothetical protein
MDVSIKENPVIVGNRLVKKESVHILAQICVLARKDGVNMINIWAGTQKWIAQAVVVSNIIFYLDIMENDTIIVILLLSLLGCGIIGVCIYIIIDYIRKNKKQSLYPQRHPKKGKK